ncbi:MAG: alpha/beta hydrolase family protein, partial [Candidatus Limnocylindria bacterium]
MIDIPATERDGVRVHDIVIADDVEAFLVEPTEGTRGPAIIFLHWFDTEASDGNRTQFLREAVGHARDHGVVSLLPQGRFPWAADPADAGADAERIRAEVTSHRAGIDLLAARPDVDGARIALVGHDFGAMHGTLLAADVERVAAAVLTAATPRWGDWFLPFWPIDGDEHRHQGEERPLDDVVGAAHER